MKRFLPTSFSLRTLFITVSLIALFLPILGIASLRIFENVMHRQTEAKLASEGAYVHALYMDALKKVLNGATPEEPLIRVIPAGDANLVNETLDFRVEPKVVGTIKGQGDTQDRSGIMVPVMVTGTFSKPKFAPDLAGMAQKQLEKSILGSGEEGQKLDKESLEKTGKGILKGILGN